MKFGEDDFWETFPHLDTNDGTWWSQCTGVKVGDKYNKSICVEVSSHLGKTVVRWRKA
jgi:hypothetical protein